MIIHKTFSTKCLYALKAILELVLHEGFGVIKSQQIASAQGIPLRFLEIILAELRQGGFVDSKRGSSGGYKLARPSETITVAQIIDFIEGRKSDEQTRRAIDYENNPLRDMWDKLDRVCSEVLASTSFADLAVEAEKQRDNRILNYVI